MPGDTDTERYDEEYPIVATEGGDGGGSDGAVGIMHRQDFLLDDALYSEFNS